MHKHTRQVITYGSPSGSKIDVCTACDKLGAEVPRNHRGEEHCSVEHGEHRGYCGLGDRPQQAAR